MERVMGNKRTKLISRTDKRFLDTSSSYAGEEFGSICWTVEVEEIETPDGERTVHPNCSLRVSDCFRVIHLAIQADNAEEFDNRIDKIEVLEESLRELKKTLRQAKKVIHKHRQTQK